MIVPSCGGGQHVVEMDLRGVSFTIVPWRRTTEDGFVAHSKGEMGKKVVSERREAVKKLEGSPMVDEGGGVVVMVRCRWKVGSGGGGRGKKKRVRKGKERKDFRR